MGNLKIINQQLFEQVLDPMFPGEFKITKNNDLYTLKRYCMIQDFSPDINLDDAFWLAEKIGLFQHLILGYDFLLKEWRIGEPGGISVNYIDYFCQAKTIPEVICNAILVIYSKKG